MVARLTKATQVVSSSLGPIIDRRDYFTLLRLCVAALAAAVLACAPGLAGIASKAGSTEAVARS
jgi:hypothetical protein